MSTGGVDVDVKSLVVVIVVVVISVVVVTIVEVESVETMTGSWVRVITAKNSCTRWTDEIRLKLSIQQLEGPYQGIHTFWHETSRSRHGILNSNKHAVRQCSGGYVLLTSGINKCRCIGVRRTVTDSLDNFGENTSCCWGNVNYLAGRGILFSVGT